MLFSANINWLLWQQIPVPWAKGSLKRNTAPEYPPGMPEQAGRWHNLSVCVYISDELNFTCKLSFCLSQPLNEADISSKNVKQWLQNRINS